MKWNKDVKWEGMSLGKSVRCGVGCSKGEGVRGLRAGEVKWH